MRINTNAVCLLLLAFSMQACKVDKDDPNAAKANANWTLAGQYYSSLTNSSTGNHVHFNNGPTQGVWGIFTALPDGSIATYKIKRGPASALASDEMVLQVDNGTNESWYSTGEGNQFATVSKDFYGDVTVKVPLVSVRHFTSGVMQADSTTASAEMFYLKR